jgi:uncharacterized protein (UPF0335 family)
MKSFRLFLFERSFMFTLCVALGLAAAPGVFAFVEDPSPVEASMTAAPIAINGEWTAHLSSKDASRIQLNFTRRTEKGGYNQNGNTMKLSDLQGLSTEIAAPTRIDVSFKLAREAGTISMEGYFQGGRGAGLWTFTPNSAFASSMASRGYASLTEEDLLRATFHNLTTKYADEIKASGYDQLTFAQLSRAATHDISVDYIRDLRNSGFENLTMENVIRASNHDISSAYVKEVAAMGFGSQPLDKVIRLKNHDISPAYIGELKAAGFENLTLDEVIRMKNHDITADFVNQIKGEGFSNVSSATIIRLKNHDVDREFIQRAKAQYPNASLEEMIRFKNNGTVK